MPAPFQDLRSTLSPLPQIQVQVRPLQNALQSLILLNNAERVSGLNDWVHHTYYAMSPDERWNNRLVMEGLFLAITPDEHLDSIPVFLAHLENLPARMFQEKFLHSLARLKPRPGQLIQDIPIPDAKQVLASPENYLNYLRQQINEEDIDQDIEMQAFSYLVDPPALKQITLSHLRWMWEKYLSSEWLRVRPILEEVVSAFHEHNVRQMDRYEAVRFVTGRPLEDDLWRGSVDNAQQLVFVPHPHLGPYRSFMRIEDTLFLYFGARLPEGAFGARAEINRGEILSRLNALADDIRLQILQRIAQKGEASAQEIISALSLSQSTASRNLSQLVTAGFLLERRSDIGKRYRLNTARLDSTLQAVASFLLEPPTEPQES